MGVKWRFSDVLKDETVFMSSTMHDSTFEKLIGTVLEPHNHIDGLVGTSKSSLSLQNSWKSLPGEPIFLTPFLSK
jgi:hypothetical protein